MVGEALAGCAPYLFPVSAQARPRGSAHIPAEYKSCILVVLFLYGGVCSRDKGQRGREEVGGWGFSAEEPPEVVTLGVLEAGVSLMLKARAEQPELETCVVTAPPLVTSPQAGCDLS